MQNNESAAILEERRANWGDPVETHIRIAQGWSGILDIEVTPHQVALMMASMKLVHASLNPDNPDSLVDAGAYVEIGKRIMTEAVDAPIPYEVRDPSDIVTRQDLAGGEFRVGLDPRVTP